MSEFQRITSLLLGLGKVRVGIDWKSKASFQSGKHGMEESSKVGKLCFFRVHERARKSHLSSKINPVYL